ncbi:MAG TPA: tyrosine/phenylalanine carboxypeptidase domain-containing protein, partial [Longimicrobiales bacterium]|nr:tyrosine/phenylalanine carboxypeptidase domain-containing protein [Longimicrobiales bacterium]
MSASGPPAGGKPSGKPSSGEETALVAEVLREARGRLGSGARLRRRLPRGGKIFIDGLTPFLALYRAPPEGDDPGTRQLVTSLRSYVLGPGDAADLYRPLVRGVLESLVEQVGGALILEMWAGPGSDGADRSPPPLRVHSSDPGGRTSGAFVRHLSDVRVVPAREAPPGGDRARVEAVRAAAPAAPGRSPLVADGQGDGVVWVGLEVPPLHRDAVTGQVYPERLQVLRRELSQGVEGAVHAWASRATRFEAEHPHALGRRSLGRSGRAIDARLADVAESFDLILGISPVNVDEMWTAFEASRRERAPRFRYRPLVFDPEALKRRLFQVPIERIEDPLAASLIREKQEELDLRVGMLRNRGRPAFLLGSLELFGKPD